MIEGFGNLSYVTKYMFVYFSMSMHIYSVSKIHQQ
jgi:hypothetical protein